MKPLPKLDLMLFFHNLVDRWSEDEKCGFCWTFSAPLRESDLNEYQFNNYGKCCLLVAITDYTFDTARRYNNQTKMIEDKFVYHDFKLNILATDDLGLNVYNEIKNHELCESKWATILKPIYDCVSEDEILTFCEDLGYIVQVERWSAFTRIDWLDNNYTGWTISVRLKEQL